MPVVTVGVTPPYDVTVGADALAALPELVQRFRRYQLVTQRRVLDECGDRLRAAIGDADAPALIGDGEDAKTLASVEALCRGFAASGLLRGDVIVAFGGGVVGDVAGFAASVYHRGVAVVQLPTTLLAQVDAAIGGKTAVNLPEGKNLVGAFHQPLAVLADTTTLATLPDVEYRSGLGEVAKYACMPEGHDVAAILDREGAQVMGRDPVVLSELVTACVAIKAAVVAADPEERTGARATLNLGHTLAHALETASGHTLAHGEAVAIGLVFATNLAAQLERVGTEVPERVTAMLTQLGLPITVPDSPPTAAELTTVMTRDKKAKGGLTFVLPGPDGLETVDDPPARAIESALRVVGVGG
jgi:3-dehydroquinate synthase